jgi:hypothetical protein
MKKSIGGRQGRKHVSWLAVLLLSFPALVLAACGAGGGQLPIGGVAPDFSLPSERGEQIALADYRGKQPVLLFFHMALG